MNSPCIACTRNCLSISAWLWSPHHLEKNLAKNSSDCLQSMNLPEGDHLFLNCQQYFQRLNLCQSAFYKLCFITSEQMIESCMSPCNRRNQRNFLIQMSTVNHESVLNCLKLIFVKGTCVMHQTSGQSLMSMKNRVGAHKIV